LRGRLSALRGRLSALRGRLSGFDYVVLAGAAVNLLVVGALIGFWLLAG